MSKPTPINLNDHTQIDNALRAMTTLIGQHSLVNQFVDTKVYYVYADGEVCFTVDLISQQKVFTPYSEAALSVAADLFGQWYIDGLKFGVYWEDQ